MTPEEDALKACISLLAYAVYSLSLNRNEEAQHTVQQVWEILDKLEKSEKSERKGNPQ